MTTFGERVREARAATEMTQAGLAAALDVSLSSVRDWEARGRSPRDWAVYRDLAWVLRVPADFLLGLTDVREPYPGRPNGPPGAAAEVAATLETAGRPILPNEDTPEMRAAEREAASAPPPPRRGASGRRVAGRR